MTHDHDEIGIQHWPLLGLAPAPRNDRKHDIPKTKESLRRHGMIDALVLDERTGKLLGGHGRVEALKEMYRDDEGPPDRVLLDEHHNWLVPVQMGISSRDDEHAERMVLALNRVGENLYKDSLLEHLLELKESTDGLTGTGFDESNLQDLFKEVPVPSEDQREFLVTTYAIIVDCKDETHQLELIEQFSKLGLKCRALVS